MGPIQDFEKVCVFGEGGGVLTPRPPPFPPPLPQDIQTKTESPNPFDVHVSHIYAPKRSGK